jgi:hypothetical protein
MAAMEGRPTAAEAAEQHGPARMAEQLLMWLVACLAGLPDNALAGLGLGERELAACRLRWGAELESMQVLQAVGRHLTRGRIAELLRVRVSGLALTARTPGEMAAVARAVKSLPEWVWDGAAVQGDGAQAAGPGGAGRPARGEAGGQGRPPQPGVQVQAPTGNPLDGILATWEGAGMPSAALVDSMFGPAAPLNRAQRRRLEAQQRKKG